MMTEESMESKTAETLGTYVVPEWSTKPDTGPWELEVLKSGSVLTTINLQTRPSHLLGRNGDVCTIHLEHPSISRQHAVIQFGPDNKVFLTDLGSAHGTFVNKKRLEVKKFQPLNPGDVLKFGESTRLYLLVGPPELSEQSVSVAEQTLIRIRERREKKKLEEEKQNEVTWGIDMTDVESRESDSVTESGNDSLPEYVRIARQNAKQKSLSKVSTKLTSNQVHANDKVLFERLEGYLRRANNLETEIDRIRAKDLQQSGGLTEGQLNQIDRNETRLATLRDKIYELETTIQNKNQSRNDSASSQAMNRKRRRGIESDDKADDEFYNRANESDSAKITSSISSDGGLVIRKSKVLSKSDPKKTRKISSNSQVESVESLKTKIEKLERAIRVALASKKPLQQKLLKNEEKLLSADELDQIVIQSSISVIKDELVALDKEINTSEADLKALKVLLSFAQPALSMDPPASSTTPMGPPSTTPMGPPSTTPMGPPSTTPMGPPTTTPMGPPSTSSMGPPSTTPMGPPSTTPMGPPSTTPMGPPSTTPMGPPSTTPMGPPSTSPMGPPSTTPMGPPSTSPMGPPTIPPRTETALPKLPTPTKPVRVLGPSIPATEQNLVLSETTSQDEWVPPSDQTGDGKTALNAKYGY